MPQPPVHTPAHTCHPYVADWLRWCRNRGLAETSVAQYHVDIERLLAFVGGPERLTDDTLRAYLDATRLPKRCRCPKGHGRRCGHGRRGPLSRRTRRLYTTEAKSLAAFCARRGYLPADPLLEVEIPREPKPLARDIPRPEVELFIDWLYRRCSVRERAELLLVVLIGPRCREMAGAKREDLRLGAQPSLKVLRKGGDEQIIPLHPAVAAALGDLVATYDWPTGALFEDGRRCVRTGRVLYPGKHIAGKSFGVRIRRRMRRAADELAAEHGAEVTPTIRAETAHAWRHTLATLLRRLGVSIEVRMRLLSHGWRQAQRYAIGAQDDGIREALALLDALGVAVPAVPAVPDTDSKPPPAGSPPPSGPPKGPRRPIDNRPPSKPPKSSTRARQPARPAPRTARARRR